MGDAYDDAYDDWLMVEAHYLAGKLQKENTMSDYEMKEGNWSAFKNKRKSDAKHPDYTGEIKLQGKLHFFDLWVKQDRNGNNYFSGRVGQEKTGKQNDDYQRPLDKPVMDNTRAGGVVDDLDVPFAPEFR
jgi:hypothetical protein